MKYAAAIILLFMSSYILLHLYFDWRLEKRIKRYNKWLKRNPPSQNSKKS